MRVYRRQFKDNSWMVRLALKSHKGNDEKGLITKFLKPFYGEGAINKPEGPITNEKIIATHLTKRYLSEYIKMSYRSAKKKTKDEPCKK